MRDHDHVEVMCARGPPELLDREADIFGERHVGGAADAYCPILSERSRRFVARRRKRL
jgi:hypothetical protein